MRSRSRIRGARSRRGGASTAEPVRRASRVARLPAGDRRTRALRRRCGEYGAGSAHPPEFGDFATGTGVHGPCADGVVTLRGVRPAEPDSRFPGLGVPRSLAIVEAWAELDGVEPFTGRTGLPLARTVKLLLDPLVLRPVRNPHLAMALLSVEAAAELRALVRRAAPDLRAAAEWFVLLKRARRRAGITEGNPQDLYFQRAYELARTHGAPAGGRGVVVAEADAEVADAVSEALADLHDDSRVTAAGLREYVTEPGTSGELRRLIELTWAAARRAERVVAAGTVERAGTAADARGSRGAGRAAPGGSAGDAVAGSVVAVLTIPGAAGPVMAEKDDGAARPASVSAVDAALARFLDECANDEGDDAFDALVASRAGTAGAAGLESAGAARRLGLSDRDLPLPPEVGASASKSSLPAPFDRSILERLFAALPAIADRGDDIGELVHAEIVRAAGGWQLAEEPSRVLLVVATRATAGLDDDEGPRGGDARIPGTAIGEPGTPDPSATGAEADAGRAARRTEPPAPASDAARRLRERWRREPFVHRALRLAEPGDETERVREAVMRRLWVRLHGRELREEPLAAEEAWPLVDGALRSVILDRRDRVKTSIARHAEGGAA